MERSVVSVSNVEASFISTFLERAGRTCVLPLLRGNNRNGCVDHLEERRRGKRLGDGRMPYVRSDFLAAVYYPCPRRLVEQILLG